MSLSRAQSQEVAVVLTAWRKMDGYFGSLARLSNSYAGEMVVTEKLGMHSALELNAAALNDCSNTAENSWLSVLYPDM